jgi:hypothetical protein
MGQYDLQLLHMKYATETQQKKAYKICLFVVVFLLSMLNKYAVCFIDLEQG